jgi:3-deoxy-manno-octulosonate cytidylyltransferase (CMP-KDO synthetase)
VFRHVGVYAYRPAALERWIALPPVAEEIEERLEQLRPLRHGMTIGVEPLRVPAPPGVDSEEDLRLVEAAL